MELPEPGAALPTTQGSLTGQLIINNVQELGNIGPPQQSTTSELQEFRADNDYRDLEKLDTCSILPGQHMDSGVPTDSEPGQEVDLVRREISHDNENSEKNDNEYSGLDNEIDLEARYRKIKDSMEETEFNDIIEKDCEECGIKVEDMNLCLLGLDVKALFPSMSARKTGEIIRKRMMKSEMKVEGFNWKMGLVYILMNKNLTSNLGTMWRLLPFRKKTGGTAPGMSSQGMSGKSGRVEDQWSFRIKEVSREQLMEIVGRCAEIAVRIVFKNISYNFGGRSF